MMREPTALEKLYAAPGEPLPEVGINPDYKQQMIQRALKFGLKDRVLQRWIWIDVTDDEHTEVLFGEMILERGISREPTKVRTSPVIAFHPPAIAITKNTAYILWGEGVRKKMDAENVLALV